jgi:Ca2+-binding RTX toxin-like protein
MTTLSVPVTHDYSSNSLPSMIATIDFTGIGQIVATFAAAQIFNSGGIADNIQISLSAATSPNNSDEIRIVMAPSDVSFDGIKSWAYGNLNGNHEPKVVIEGSALGDQIIGSDFVQTSIVGGAGADTLLGGGGGSIFVYTAAGDAQAGEYVDGSTGHSSNAEILVTNGASVNFTGVTIANVDVIAFDAAGGTATFTSAQMAVVRVLRDITLSGATVVVDGSNVNLSGLTLLSWGAGDQVKIVGTAGADILTGGSGQHTIIDGGRGKDILTDGAGDDAKFLFDTTLNKLTNVDHITNFAHGLDKIELSHHIFGAHLAINAHSFHAAPHATHALNAAQHIIYNKTTGALYFEKSLATPAVEFAVLTGHPAINFHDFVMVA